ncbi:hypothetical protein PIROE2DRAFT_20537 [Piromyces sp. E2]|nr:hypothetical protein PIROE2DRAFT_20537 [Piromyces sp. E2]|eukprot:OUM64302.1 hypothetical protein PIROE2DRAFT_20537 [Piromyces sp. E2]
MEYDEKKASEAFLLENKNTTVLSVRDDGDEEKSMKPPRKSTVCCLCCPLWLCVGITVSILAFIGIMLLIFWPKIPSANIASIGLSTPPEGKSSVRYEFPSNDENKNSGVEIDLDINVNVTNNNFYNLYVHKVAARVYLQTANLEKTKIGSGEQKNLKFEKHATTTFVLPLTIGYYVKNVLEDKALTYLLKACTYHQDIDIQYEVDIGIHFIEIFYTPTYQGKVTFQCPQTDIEESIQNGLQSVLIGDIYSSINDYFSQFTDV